MVPYGKTFLVPTDASGKLVWSALSTYIRVEYVRIMRSFRNSEYLLLVPIGTVGSTGREQVSHSRRWDMRSPETPGSI